MRIILAGGGEVVYFLGRVFLKKGYSISIINPDREECVNLARNLDALVINGEPTDPLVLEDARAREAQFLIAVTPEDHVNLACCQTATLLFNIVHTLAMVNDPENYDVFMKMGIRRVFNQTDFIVAELEKEIGYEFVDHLLSHAGSQVIIEEIDLSEDMPAVGQEIGSIGIPDRAKIAGVLRGGKFELSKSGNVLQAGDKLLIASAPDLLGTSLRMICGDKI